MEGSSQTPPETKPQAEVRIVEDPSPSSKSGFCWYGIGDAGNTGGYKESLFIRLTKKEKAAFRCNICQLIMRNGRKCINGHVFCKSCLDARVGDCDSVKGQSAPCPTCKEPGKYKVSEHDKPLQNYCTFCPLSNCEWGGVLRQIEEHLKGPWCTGRVTTAQATNTSSN